MGKPATMNPFTGFAGGSNRKRAGADWYSHNVVTTTAGTIDTTNSDQVSESRMTVAKTAAKAGRYTITLPDRYKKLLFKSCEIIGPDDVAFGGVATGQQVRWRDNDVDGGAADGTLELQFVRGDTYADAEIPDGYSFQVVLCAARGI